METTMSQVWHATEPKIAPQVVYTTTIIQETELRVYLFGSMRIERDNVKIRLPRRKVESLLAYLFLHPEQHVRDHLATLFWGDSSDAEARHSLRTALATVRQQVSPDLLLTDRDHVQLNPDFALWVDLRQLLSLEEMPDHPSVDFLQTHLALWQGDLLAGFYDEWITIEREHYQTRLIKLFLQVTQNLRARSEYAQAIVVAKQVLALDPANEHAHQHLMFCYVASGDRPAALRQYELCVRALQDDVDAPPMPETTALYQWIKQQESEEAAPAGKITNLPIPLTSFVGRKRETAEVKRLLSPSYQNKGGNYRKGVVRLLTLTGAGGNGKTRLAIQVATDLIDSFAHGVWWVELAALCDEALVVRAVAKSLGVNEVANQALSQTIANFVGDKEMLLVLDNCEHLIVPCADLAAELLAQCPNLQILATSREPLNIAGEALWQVPTFSAPDPAKMTVADALLQFESVRLFVERATTVQPGFALNAENAQAVAEICQRLDGIPLAIELAAARVKVLAVEQIAVYLSGALGARFSLLTQGSRVVLPRHQTLRATIDWSYNLLDEAERLLFRQVAVFRGGFTLEALAQIMGSGSPLAIPNILDLLTQLVDKSLVIVELQGGQNRYRLLETLREYALAQFPVSDEMKQLQQQHSEFFMGLALQAEPELMRAQRSSWLDRLEVEHANLRAGLDYLITKGEGASALRLATALHRFWDYRGYVSEGRKWLREALANRATATYAIQAEALNAAGWLAYRQGELEQARLFHEEGLSLFEQAEAVSGIADSWQYLAVIEMDRGDYATAQARLEKSLELSRTIHYENGIARALSRLGRLAWDQDRFTDSHHYHAESLHIYQRLDNQVSIALESLAVGDTERMLGDFAAARSHYEECLTIARSLGHKGLVGATLKCLGLLASKQQQYEQARQYGEEALRIFREVGDKAHTGFSLSMLGDVALKFGENSKALAYFGEYLQLMYEVGYKWPTFYALEDIAYLLIEVEQHPEAAVRLMGAADALHQETGLDVAPTFQAKYERISTTLRRQLGDEPFTTLWEQGAATPLAQVVAEATTLSLV